MTGNATARPDDDDDGRAYRLGGGGVVLLMLVYMFSMLDRQIVNILAESIKRDLGISDSEIGILTGLSFAVFYTGFGIPLARLAERGNRARLIAACLCFWSVFTIAGAAARSFAWLVAARLGVGMGEAGCLPAAHSMISDYVPEARRARAISVFMMGAPLGLLLGMAMGGVVADWFGWRMALVVAGAPGLALAAIVLLFISDPGRQTAPVARGDMPGFGETVRALASLRSYWLLTLGASLGAFVTVAQGAFLASFYLRNHAADVERLVPGLGSNAAIGISLGLILGVGGAAGTYLGGAWADRKGEGPRRYMMVSALSCLLVAPIFLAAMFAPGLLPSLLLLIPAAVLNAVWTGPAFAAIPSLSHRHSRATAAALALLVISLVSLGLGPLLVGAVSDMLSARGGGATAIRDALALTPFVSLLAAGAFWLARAACVEDVARINGSNGDGHPLHPVAVEMPK